MIAIDLGGQVAVVTGASGELGRVIARTLARAGASIAVHYHRGREQAERLLDELRAENRRSMLVQADVTRQSEVLALREQVRAELGAADIIVNNAVVQYEWRSVLEQPLEDYESQFASCVLHNVHMARAFIPDMLDKGRGRMIAINTECAMQCFPGQSAYAAAKRGLDGIVRVLAREVGPGGVTVNQVAPGWTVSDRDRAGGTVVQPAYEAELPLRRRNTDQDVADAVLFLASDLAAAITGAYLPVCSGNVMPGI